MAQDQGVLIPTIRRMQMVKEFIRWEHGDVIQPRLEISYKRIKKTLQYALRHIPSRFVEKVFFEPVGLRTSMNLGCFHEPKYIRTKNFMDATERMTRAEEFFVELQKVNFDPNDSCFNDEYYDYKMIPILF